MVLCSENKIIDEGDFMADERYFDGFETGIKYRATVCADTNNCANCAINKYKGDSSCAGFLASKPSVVRKLFETGLSDEVKVDADFMEGFENGLGIVSACCVLNNYDCDICFIHNMIEDDTVGCVEFCRDNASLVASAIADYISDGGIPYGIRLKAKDVFERALHGYTSSTPRTYYDEFCIRFPECMHTVDSVAVTCCKNVCFGLGECDKEDTNDSICTACWEEAYEGR